MIIKRLTTLIAVFIMALTMNAKLNIQKTQGWYESGCITWGTTQGTTYEVFIRPEGGTYTQLDKELVRNYGSYGRADMVGLKAGKYQFKITASNGEEAESEVFTTYAYDRNGFAHYNRTSGVGAYNNDGTLKTNARVIYVHANNAKTISLAMNTGAKSGDETRTGLQNIIQAYEKGKETRPLAIRFIGCIKAADMDAFGSSAEGLQVKGKSGSYEANITIEGIGDDATIHGFGILCRAISSVEFRNLGIMLCMDDCLSLDTDNHNIWVHNMDFFYGSTGGDSDQAKGDGTVDIKGKSSHVTVSYNHFYDSGKCSLGGMKSETTDCWMTYHHNWFDHSDSRHPRIRTAFYHIYNNYFDGNSKYGVGVTCGGSAFVESNNFRNCKYPMLISKQGTDATGDGTFSGESGGVIKSYNNLIKNERQVWYYDGKQTDGKWDAVKVSTRNASVSAIAYSGSSTYNSTADEASIKAVPSSTIDKAEDIPSIVRGELGAGRMNHGDFTWTFRNSVQDANYDVIKELKSALTTYKSTLVGLFTDITSINNGGAKNTVNAGDGKGIEQTVNDSFTPSWAGGTGGDSSDDDYTDLEPEEPEPEEPSVEPEPEEPSIEPEPDEPTTDVPVTEAVVCTFSVSNKTASSSMVTVKGNYSNSKGTVTYNGNSYSECLKIESSTTITIVPTFDCTIQLIFGGSTTAAGKNIKLDGEKIALDSNGEYSFDGKAKTTYSITKSDILNLFLIVFTPKKIDDNPDKEPEPEPDTEETGIKSNVTSNKSTNTYYTNGILTTKPTKGSLYIKNGKKYYVR